MTLEIHILSNFTNHLLVSKLENLAKQNASEIKVFGNDFDQVLQHLHSMPHTSPSSRHFFLLTRAESFDEDYAVKDSDESRKQIVDRYRQFLGEVEDSTANVQGVFHITSLFENGESIIFDANRRDSRISKRQLLRNVLHETLEINQQLNHFDVQSMIDLIGLDESWNKSQDLLFRQPLTNQFAAKLADAIFAQATQHKHSGIKVIATDADGTLWGGVIGEDSPSEIEVGHDFPGSVYFRFQEFLKEKKKEGILLALVTKNNPQDIDDFFSSRNDMPLNLDDFAIVEASWSKKSLAIEKISKQINVGLDSILFIDDSSFEILEVSSALSEVTTLSLDQKLENRISQLGNLSLKWSSGSTGEDSSRTAMIQQNLLRNKITENQNSTNFIEKLELKLEISEIVTESDHRFLRVLQLINKTNQFNMTCERVTHKDLNEFLSKGKIYIGALSDKFGDYGLIAVALVEFPDDECARFTNFLLSCRALGRCVEENFISQIIEKLRLLNIDYFEGDWVEHPKNLQTKDFYQRLGFLSPSDKKTPSKVTYRAHKKELIFNFQRIRVEYT